MMLVTEQAQLYPHYLNYEQRTKAGRMQAVCGVVFIIQTT